MLQGCFTDEADWHHATRRRRVDRTHERCSGFPATVMRVHPRDDGGDAHTRREVPSARIQPRFASPRCSPCRCYYRGGEVLVRSTRLGVRVADREWIELDPVRALSLSSAHFTEQAFYRYVSDHPRHAKNASTRAAYCQTLLA